MVEKKNIARVKDSKVDETNNNQRNKPLAASAGLKFNQLKNLESQREILEILVRRAHYLMIQMIHLANHRSDKAKGDPKVGGHPAACASCVHILGALHLVVRTGFDQLAIKPHASPCDHSYHYLLNLMLKSDLSRLSVDEMNQAMHGLRAYSQQGEPVFQSYHSVYDPDHFNFLPSGTVGIPPVCLGYLALAYRFAEDHGYQVPDAHFWALIGDSEFREGSLYEAMPDLAERELGNVTWVVDYNRQSLDGHRLTNKNILRGTDADRLERTAVANGWEVLSVRHGKFRQSLFERPGGQNFKEFLESGLSDYQTQALLLISEPQRLRQELIGFRSTLKPFLNDLNDGELYRAFADFGGHDIVCVSEALAASKLDTRRPTLVIAHTIKGWGLRCLAAPGNHNTMTTQEEVDDLQESQGISRDSLFSTFDRDTDVYKLTQERGDFLYSQFRQQQELKEKNHQAFTESVECWQDEIFESLDINLKMATYPHTQWMLGQLTAKMLRFAQELNARESRKKGIDYESVWGTIGNQFVAMAPDVGTSTNLNPAMDHRIFGVAVDPDYESEFGVKDTKTPDLIMAEDISRRFLRFEISEANCMSCLGAFGKLRDVLGITLIPLMTVYDFFIKRALDQLFYDLYWNSNFILVGTPSGVTLSPEGAQHGWKSDLQIPNQITWEPFFCQELDWILCESIRRYLRSDNEGRTGVIIRAVTRGVDQKEFLKYLMMQRRFKLNFTETPVKLCPDGLLMAGGIIQSEVTAVDPSVVWKNIRHEVLQGAYYLIDYRGYAGYEPGDNVVHIFSMGSPTTEAITASNALLLKGIYANVIVVTSPDLLLGNLATLNHYHHLLKTLDVGSAPQRFAEDGSLVHGAVIPIVSVHDGEPGLLDNIGSIVGVKQVALAVRKHSKCGRPVDIYQFQGIDSDSVIEAVFKVLGEF